MRIIMKFLYQFIWNMITISCQLLPDNTIGNKVRGVVYKPFFKSCSGNLQVSKSVHILYPYNISLGKDVFIGFNSWINGQGGVVIDDEVMLGPFVVIATGNHTQATESASSYRFGEHELKKVKIGKGTWLGANVSVMPGALIGSGSIIAAGGVVVGCADSCSLYVGVPARFKKKLKS